MSFLGGMGGNIRFDFSADTGSKIVFALCRWAARRKVWMSAGHQFASTTRYLGLAAETAESQYLGKEWDEKMAMSAMARRRFLEESLTAMYWAVRVRGYSWPSLRMLEVLRPEDLRDARIVEPALGGGVSMGLGGEW